MNDPEHIDVFIGYARQDEERAAHLASLLETRWSVWWDHHIPAGTAYDKSIERVLERAKCAVILWSSSSVKSDWVRDEAKSAKRRGILLPVTIENVAPPLGFGLDQTRDLSGWDGDDGDRRFHQLLRDVERLVSGAPAVSAGDPPQPAASQASRPTPPVSGAGLSPLIRMLERNRSFLVAIGPALLTGVVWAAARPARATMMKIFAGFAFLQIATLILTLLAYFASGKPAAVSSGLLDFFFGDMFTADRGKVLAQIMAVGLLLLVLVYLGSSAATVP